MRETGVCGFNIKINARGMTSVPISRTAYLYKSGPRIHPCFGIRIVISRAGEFSILRAAPEKYSGDIPGVGCKVSFGRKVAGAGAAG